MQLLWEAREAENEMDGRQRQRQTLALCSCWSPQVFTQAHRHNPIQGARVRELISYLISQPHEQFSQWDPELYRMDIWSYGVKSYGIMELESIS